MEAIVKYVFKNFKIRCWSFYDDILICDRNKEELKKKTDILVQELENLGFLINSDKSILSP